MFLRITNSVYRFLVGLIIFSASQAFAGNVSESEIHSYKVGHGIELQLTDGGRIFVNIVRDGKLIWRQYIPVELSAWFRPHEERRFTFDDVNQNGIPDFFYIFENATYYGQANLYSDAHFRNPVEKREPNDFPFPNVPTNDEDNAFLLCLDWGQQCVLIRYLKQGRCYKADGKGIDVRLCDSYRGKEKEAVTIETSSVVSENDWRTILSYFNKVLGEETVADFRYALSTGHTAIIKTPDLFKPLESWAGRIKIKSQRAVLYRDEYGNKKLEGYLVADDKAEVLDRYVGSVMATRDAEYDAGHVVDSIALKSNRLLVRYMGKSSMTIGWVDIADTESIQ